MTRINIFGDFTPLDIGIASIANRTAISSEILDIINNSDYNIVNLESPIVKNKKTKEIMKDGPHLKCDERSVKYLKESGFNMVTLANNHLKDFGEEGIKETLESCKRYGMKYVGAGVNLQAAKVPQIIIAGNFKIGILNICENESSIATDDKPGSNPIDEISNYYDISQLKEKTDKIIVIIHGGSEHYYYPTPRMKKRCHFYADLGVSAIVCHHIHCYSGYEIYHNVPIFYSLGNFFFYKKNKTHSYLWTTGFFVQFKIDENKMDFQLFPYVQCRENAIVSMMDDKERKRFEKKIEEINHIISDNKLLQKQYDCWLNKKWRDYIAILITWGNRYYKVAYRKKILPALISKSNAIQLLNNIRCESHNDLMKLSLEKYINER